jgi:ankyrin repeat protein
MSLLRLPFELLLDIAKNLKSERDISSFSQTNTYLHKLLSDYLYENNVKHHGSRAIIWAAENGYEKLVQMLLDKNADVNARDDHGGTALRAASGGGYERVVQMLLDKDADVNARDEDDSCCTALQAASGGGYERVVQMLLGKMPMSMLKIMMVVVALHFRQHQLVAM